MINVVSLFRRKSGMSVEDFQAYWRNQHAEIVVRMPGIRRYVQSHTILSGYRKGQPACDGVAELWFDDTDAMRALTGSDALKATRDDHPLFMNMDSYMEIVTEDVVIKDGSRPAGGVKNIELVRRKPGMPVEDFHRYWIETHGPLGASIPQVHRYVQSHTRIAAYRDGREPALDGVAQTWFDDTAAMRAAATTDEYAQTRADEVNFVDEPLEFVITTEHVIVGD